MIWAKQREECQKPPSRSFRHELYFCKDTRILSSGSNGKFGNHCFEPMDRVRSCHAMRLFYSLDFSHNQVLSINDDGLSRRRS